MMTKRQRRWASKETTPRSGLVLDLTIQHQPRRDLFLDSSYLASSFRRFPVWRSEHRNKSVAS